MRLLQWLELLSLSVVSNAAAVASASSALSAPPAQSTACGSIVNNEGIQHIESNEGRNV
jgi:hypothetical protein